MVAVLLALALALGYLLARRVVPDPWCAFAALAVGLSPPLTRSARVERVLIPTSLAGGSPTATVEKPAKLAASTPDTAIANARRRNVDVRAAGASARRSNEFHRGNFMGFSSLKNRSSLMTKQLVNATPLAS